MAILTQKYLGLTLKSPVILSSSSLSMDIENVKDAEKAGVGAIVLKSLFEEEILSESNYLQEQSLGYFHDNTSDYLSYMVRDQQLQKYTDHIKQIKDETDLPVIASLNAISLNEWHQFAEILEGAGADALELNIYIIPNGAEESSASIEKQYLDILKQVKGSSNLPVSIKLSPNFTNIYLMAKQLADRGVDGLVLFNRFYRPDVDLDKLCLTGSNPLSHSEELYSVIRWTALLAKELSIDFAATSGINSGYDLLKVIAVGASVGEVASVCYKYGVDYIRKINDQMLQWLDEKQIDSVEELTGRLNISEQNKRQFERFQYIKAIKDSSTIKY